MQTGDRRSVRFDVNWTGKQTLQLRLKIEREKKLSVCFLQSLSSEAISYSDHFLVLDTTRLPKTFDIHLIRL